MLRLMRLVLIVCALLPGCGARTPLGVPAHDAQTSDAGTDAGPQPIDAAMIDAPSCVEIEATFRETTPTMVFVIDRSGSMDAPYIPPRGGYRGATRWGAVLEVLVGEGGILPGLQDRVRLGAITFTSDGVTCPDMHTLAPALYNSDAIASLLRSDGPNGGTPIAETMDAIAMQLDTLTIDGSPPTLVLMTDGEPSGCGGTALDPSEAVAHCFDRGARTYVIGLGDEVGEAYLQSMANAGGGVTMGEPDAEYWPAVQAMRFVDALDTISQRVADCRATLSSPIVVARACEARVRLGAQLLTCDDPDGWSALDASTIELRGEACTRLVRDGTVRVTLQAPCDVRP